jgi:biotin carboxyl carrier protein
VGTEVKAKQPLAQIGGAFVTPAFTGVPVQAAASTQTAFAPVSGTVLRYAVDEGASVNSGDTILILESMMMELGVKAAVSGPVHFLVPVGTEVKVKQPLAQIGGAVEPPASSGAPAQAAASTQASPVQAAPAYVPGSDYVLPVSAGVLRLTRDNARLPGGFSGVLIIPEGVKVIESDCFSDQKDITELWLPKSLKRIRGNAFCDDNGETPDSLLEKITIGADVDLEEPYWDTNFYIAYRESRNGEAGTYVRKKDGLEYFWDLEEK